MTKELTGWRAVLATIGLTVLSFGVAVLASALAYGSVADLLAGQGNFWDLFITGVWASVVFTCLTELPGIDFIVTKENS